MSGETVTTSTGDPQLRIVREAPAFWRVTFDNPPLNIVGPDGVRALAALMDQLETDEHVKVIVFDSASPDFFIAHYDVLGDIALSTGMQPGPTGMHPVPDFMVWLARAPVVSIAAIRGRATGIGSELALACDIRFAVARIRKSRNGRWGRDSSPAVDPWRGCRG